MKLWRITLWAIFGFILADARAQTIRPESVETELGEALGFQLYRFEAELAADEVLVVEHRTENVGKETLVIQTIQRPSGSNSSYQITLVDSGASHPSLRGTTMLRYPGHESFIENRRLAQTESGADLTFKFAEDFGNAFVLIHHWSAWVESYEKARDRLGGLPALKPGAGWSSNKLIAHSTPSESATDAE
ncbi:hypothetical protein [Synoicihabitans lomoniglobus]|uniref:Uncharacterized protein n=1 Tax=Synoicihabitans lomoniglobus TaxID=2909285 RepID=A0AAE9ZWR4_9BACT|nr:hypothetical protein [Opitutaceae bacterium LMO-M01]WED64841.1 hypothetical protein PXH66_21050 [Opitutaceae bacterium LMO-M01]